MSYNSNAGESTAIPTTYSDSPAASISNHTLNTTGTFKDEELLQPVNPLDSWLYYELIIHSIILLPENINLGGKVDIWTDIYCSGNYESRIRAFLIVNQELIEDKILIIPPDENFPFVFSFTPEKAGNYDITVRVACETANKPANPYDTQCYHLDACATVAAGE
ncbi:MAG: hypothetical protein PHX29_06965 [Dehalococcoidales bacterium]|nr:hypothetical protein [Dehalococcoidales bacterium]